MTPREGALSPYGPDQTGNPGRAAAQPEKHQRRIPRNTLTVITGLSGSGKSSLAFDTIYAEGQRRSVESLSVYARQFLDQMERPEVDVIEDLSLANWYGAKIQRNVTLLQRLSGHPKPANEGHLKTGQRESPGH